MSNDIHTSTSYSPNEKFKNDSRPRKGWWAPGSYLRTCYNCEQGFLGDKRAGVCADCAYTMKQIVGTVKLKGTVEIDREQINKALNIHFMGQEGIPFDFDKENPHFKVLQKAQYNILGSRQVEVTYDIREDGRLVNPRILS